MTTDPNDLLRAMVSVRGLEGGDAIPVTRFRGRLMAVVPRQSTYNNVPQTNVDLKFDSVVVMETTEPYPFETAEIAIKLSNRKNSGWGIFAQSLAPKIPASKDIFDCIGSEMEMARRQHLYGYSRDEFIPDPTGQVDPATNQIRMVPSPMLGNVWEVQTIRMEGEVPASTNGSAAIEAALRILDGKTEADFSKEIWADPLVKQDPSLSSMLLQRSFIPTMVTAKKVAMDEGTGIYHTINVG